MRSTVILLRCLLQGWCDLDSTSGENWKESLTSTISIEASFNGDNNGETLNVNGRKKWDIKCIQILPALRDVGTEILGKVFITKKSTQCKTSPTLKIDALEIRNCQNMNCFSWVELIPVLIYPKYWYYNSPYLELPCLPQHLCQILS